MPRELGGRDGDDEQGDTDDANPLPDGAEYAVPFHREILVNGEQAARHDDEIDADPDDPPRGVYYSPGEPIPTPVAEVVYDAFGDTIAILDEHGERIDTPGMAERGGEISAESALRRFRHEHGAELPTQVTLFECDCGKRFDSKDALYGHRPHCQAADADEAADEGDGAADGEAGADGSDALAERLDADGEGETADEGETGEVRP